MVEVEEVSGVPETKPVDNQVPVERASKRVYAREFLLSFAEHDSCKPTPNDLDPAILRELSKPGIPIPHGGPRGRRDSESDGGHGREAYSRSPQEVPEWRKDSWRTGGSVGAGNTPLTNQHRRRSEEEPNGGAFSSSYPPKPNGSWDGNGPHYGHDHRHNHRPDHSRPDHNRPEHGHGPHGPHGPAPGAHPHGRWDNRSGPGDRERERERGFRGYRNVDEDDSGDKGRQEQTARRTSGTSGSTTGSQMSLRPGWSNQEHADGKKDKPQPSSNSSQSPPLHGSQGDRYLGPQRSARSGPAYQTARPKEDHPDHDTFRGGDASRDERLILERKRREEFELMRSRHRQQALDQKVKDHESGKTKKHDMDSLWDPETFSAEDPPAVSAPLAVPAPSKPKPAMPTPISTPPRPAVPPGFAKPGGSATSSPASVITNVQIAPGGTNRQIVPGAPPGFKPGGLEGRFAAAEEKAESTRSTDQSDAAVALVAAAKMNGSSGISLATDSNESTLSPNQLETQAPKSASPPTSQNRRKDATEKTKDEVSPEQGPSSAKAKAAASSAAVPNNAESSAVVTSDGGPKDGRKNVDAAERIVHGKEFADSKPSESEGVKAGPLDSGSLSKGGGEQLGSLAQGTSLLDKLFQQAGADRAGRSKPIDNHVASPTASSNASKFSQWFSSQDEGQGVGPLEESKGNMPANLTPSSQGRLNEALKPGAGGQEPVDITSPITALLPALPMPKAPSLEDIEKGIGGIQSHRQVAPGQALPGRGAPAPGGAFGAMFGLPTGASSVNKKSGGPGNSQAPRFMTLEDIEQSILAEAGTGQVAPREATSGGSKSVESVGPTGQPPNGLLPGSFSSQPRDSASQHLLSLLLKAPRGNASTSGGSSQGPEFPPASIMSKFTQHPQNPSATLSGHASTISSGHILSEHASAVSSSSASLGQDSALARFGKAIGPPGRNPSSVIGRSSPGPVGPIGRPAKGTGKPLAEKMAPGMPVPDLPWLGSLTGPSQALAVSRDLATLDQKSMAGNAAKPAPSQGSPLDNEIMKQKIIGAEEAEGKLGGGADGKISAKDGQGKNNLGQDEDLSVGGGNGVDDPQLKMSSDKNTGVENVNAKKEGEGGEGKGWNLLSDLFRPADEPNSRAPPGDEGFARLSPGTGSPGLDKSVSIKTVRPPQKSVGGEQKPVPDGTTNRGPSAVIDPPEPTPKSHTTTGETSEKQPNSSKQVTPPSSQSGSTQNLTPQDLPPGKDPPIDETVQSGPPFSQLSSFSQTQSSALPGLSLGWTPFGMSSAETNDGHSQFLVDLLAGRKANTGGTASGTMPHQQHQPMPPQQREPGPPTGQYQNLNQNQHLNQTLSQNPNQISNQNPNQILNQISNQNPNQNPNQIRNHNLNQHLNQNQVPGVHQGRHLHGMQPLEQYQLAGLPGVGFQGPSALQDQYLPQMQLRNGTMPPGMPPFHEPARGTPGSANPIGQYPFPYQPHQGQLAPGPGGYQTMRGTHPSLTQQYLGTQPTQGLPPGMQQRGNPYFPPPNQHPVYGGHYPPAGSMGHPQQAPYQGVPAGAPRQMLPGDAYRKQGQDSGYGAGQGGLGGFIPGGKLGEAGPGQGIDRWFGSDLGVGFGFGGLDPTGQGVGGGVRAPAHMMGLEELERQLRLG